MSSGTHVTKVNDIQQCAEGRLEEKAAGSIKVDGVRMKKRWLGNQPFVDSASASITWALSLTHCLRSKLEYHTCLQLAKCTDVVSIITSFLKKEVQRRVCFNRKKEGWRKFNTLYSSSSETIIYSWAASSSSGASLPREDADRDRLRFGLLSARILEISVKIVFQWSFVRAFTVGMYWVARRLRTLTLLPLSDFLSVRSP